MLSLNSFLFILLLINPSQSHFNPLKNFYTPYSSSRIARSDKNITKVDDFRPTQETLDESLPKFTTEGVIVGSVKNESSLLDEGQDEDEGVGFDELAEDLEEKFEKAYDVGKNLVKSQPKFVLALLAGIIWMSFIVCYSHIALGRIFSLLINIFYFKRSLRDSYFCCLGNTKRRPSSKSSYSSSSSSNSKNAYQKFKGYDPNIDTNQSIYIGSLKISIIAGSIIIKDFRYTSTDFTNSIQYLTIVFKYWIKYRNYGNDGMNDYSLIPNKSNSLGHGQHASQRRNNSNQDPQYTTSNETRLQISIKGYDMHIFNRSFLYKDLLKAFNQRDNHRFDSFFGSKKEDNSRSDDNLMSSKKSGMNDTTSSRKKNDEESSEQLQGEQRLQQQSQNQNEEFWNSFYNIFPVIESNLEEVRFTFGNEQVDYSLIVTVKSARKMTYRRVLIEVPGPNDLHQNRGSLNNYYEFQRYEIKSEDIKN